MKAETHLARVSPFWLLIPLAVSSAPWIFVSTIPRNAGQDLEGDLFLAAFIGALSFVLAGPLAGALLGAIMRNRAFGFWGFTVLFFLVSLPVLSFQVAFYSASILPIFIGSALTDADMPQYMIRAALLGLCIYAIYLAILYPLAKRGVELSTAGAILLSCASFAVIVFLTLHR
jgi:hypothetical protein